ncbi:hypothetical protein G6735_04690 [Polynucleobacter paneuropaeus]|nr:hypothetical protein [Polynucleobacter paneuropaeus]
MNIIWFLRQYARHFKVFLGSFLFPDPLLKFNQQFKNFHKGERCFILGSGHSINEQDLTLLKGRVVMTQNHFHVHRDIKIISPTYHVLVPKYQPKDFDLDWEKWFTSMHEGLPKNTKLFMDVNSKYLIDRLNIFAKRTFFIKAGLSNIVRKRAPVDITKPIYSVPTVLTECLAIAIYMGFSEIYLLGMDLDQIFQLYRGDDGNNIRFYGSSPITRNKSEINLDRISAATGMDWINFWIIWDQCNLLRKIAEERGIKIKNASSGGILNVFERCCFEDIIKN